MAKKILLVDNEPWIVDIVRGNLERAGYEVVTAFDGKDALEKVQLESPDLVILDEKMPSMDGLEVMKYLRANPATRELPVIIMQARAANADVYRGWKKGVEAYLMKPFTPMQLNGWLERMFAAQDESVTANG